MEHRSLLDEFSSQVDQSKEQFMGFLSLCFTCLKSHSSVSVMGWLFKKQNNIFLLKKVNKFLNDLSEKLNINRDFEKAEILDEDDENTSREEWEAYFVYLDYLMYYQKKMLHLHKVAKFDIREKKLRKFDLVS